MPSAIAYRRLLRSTGIHLRTRVGRLLFAYTLLLEEKVYNCMLLHTIYVYIHMHIYTYCSQRKRGEGTSRGRPARVAESTEYPAASSTRTPDGDFSFFACSRNPIPAWVGAWGFVQEHVRALNGDTVQQYADERTWHVQDSQVPQQAAHALPMVTSPSSLAAGTRSRPGLVLGV